MCHVAVCSSIAERMTVISMLIRWKMTQQDGGTCDKLNLQPSLSRSTSLILKAIIKHNQEQNST